MASLPCPDPVLHRLDLDRYFQPCEPRDGDEIFPNGIFEFDITRLRAHVGASGQFRAELISLHDIPAAGSGTRLNELTIVAASLSRPVILAEIAPGRHNLIDGHHRVAKARRLGQTSISAYRIRCPEHLAFLTSTRAYEAYVEYWNSKVDEILGPPPRMRSTRLNRALDRAVNRPAGATEADRSKVVARVRLELTTSAL
jgi:hypothetical protein